MVWSSAWTGSYDGRLTEHKRLLVVTAPSRAASFSRRGAEVVSDVAALERLDGPFDAAHIEGLLEREPWDRWVLQCVHRVLRPGAPVRVVVPPLLSAASAADVGFLAHAAKRVFVRLVQRWQPDFELSGRVRRRYHVPRLARRMETLGYAVLEERRAELLARKAPSLWGEAGRAWPQAHSHRAEHATRYAPLYAAREAWLARFAEYRRAAARELDPGQWRGARVLALAPHPDDELIGCGGTLCRLAAAGAKVIILQATDGARLRSLRDLPQSRRKFVRLEEARRVAAAIGAELLLWGQEDSRLRRCEAAVAALARALDEVRPTHVFTPFLGDPHADHRTLSGILADALLLAAIEPCVLQYEVWSLVPANLYCDVTREAQRVERLLLLYARAMRADDFVHFCESRNLARALELTGRPGYAEAFLASGGAEFVRLTKRSP